jgi:hypothetical protein
MRSAERSGSDEEPLSISVRDNDRTNVLIDAKHNSAILLLNNFSPLKIRGVRGVMSYRNNPL